MKKIIYITVLLIGFSCTESSVPDPIRPSHLPKTLPRDWGHYEQKAWEEGRLTYNEDTTMCTIISERDWAKTLKGMPAAYADSVKKQLLDR